MTSDSALESPASLCDLIQLSFPRCSQRRGPRGYHPSTTAQQSPYHATARNEGQQTGVVIQVRQFSARREVLSSKTSTLPEPFILRQEPPQYYQNMSLDELMTERRRLVEAFNLYRTRYYNSQLSQGHRDEAEEAMSDLNLEISEVDRHIHRLGGNPHA